MFKTTPQLPPPAPEKNKSHQKPTKKQTNKQKNRVELKASKQHTTLFSTQASAAVDDSVTSIKRPDRQLHHVVTFTSTVLNH